MTSSINCDGDNKDWGGLHFSSFPFCRKWKYSRPLFDEFENQNVHDYQDDKRDQAQKDWPGIGGLMNGNDVTINLYQTNFTSFHENFCAFYKVV